MKTKINKKNIFYHWIQKAILLGLLPIFVLFCDKEKSQFSSPIENPVLPPPNPIYQDTNTYHLGFKYPNYPEWKVSGRGTGTIERGSYEFLTLLEYYDNPLIVFKNEENYTDVFNLNRIIQWFPQWDNDTDHFIAPQLIPHLDKLADLLYQLDPGLAIRITESYDNNLEHGDTNTASLHYFGRAIDLNLYDKRSQTINYDYLPKLTELCVQAGFDWVYYEDHQHVHVSCKARTPYKPQIVFYQIDLHENQELGIFDMVNRNGGWAIKTLMLQPGLYHIKFQEKDRYTYGFRKKNALGRDDHINPAFSYYGEPIAFNIENQELVEFKFNPNTLQYSIRLESREEVPVYDISLLTQFKKLIFH